jgi:hypothetical protein
VVKARADQGKHVLFVDMSKPPSGALSTDGIHPNDTVGYPMVCEPLLRVGVLSHPAFGTGALPRG